MVKGWVPISVREGVKQRLEQIYNSDKDRPKNQKFTAYVDNLLSDIVDNDQRLREYGSFMELINCDVNYVMLKDYFSGKYIIVEMAVKSGVLLYCQEDNSGSCIHVGFCLALPQVCKALIDKGYPPISNRVAKLRRGNVKLIEEPGKIFRNRTVESDV